MAAKPVAPTRLQGNSNRCAPMRSVTGPLKSASTITTRRWNASSSAAPVIAEIESQQKLPLESSEPPASSS